MSIISTALASRTRTLSGAAAIATALLAAPAAQADILNFEQVQDSPFVFNLNTLQFGNFWVQGYNGIADDEGSFVGAIVDGADAGTCVGISCPVNNPTSYYAALDDAFMYFGMMDNSKFRLRSLQASYIGAGLASYPATAGVLVLQGYDAKGIAVGSEVQLGLGGPTGGAFNFGAYDLSSTIGQYEVSFVRVLGYSCHASPCNRNSNYANFAIDNIVTIPEPTSWVLMGLGLLGLGAFSRRRSA